VVTYVHQGISVDHCLPHFDYVDVVVAQGESIPHKVAILRAIRLSVTVLVHHVLNRIDLLTTVTCIYNNILPLVSFGWSHN
jgi:hypothetical protein